MRTNTTLNRLLRLGQGPRPDLMAQDMEVDRETDTDMASDREMAPDMDAYEGDRREARPKKREVQECNNGMVKGLRQVRREAKLAARAEAGAQEQEKRSGYERGDRAAIILALFQIMMPVALGGLAVAGLVIWLLCRFWLHV